MKVNKSTVVLLAILVLPLAFITATAAGHPSINDVKLVGVSEVTVQGLMVSVTLVDEPAALVDPEMSFYLVAVFGNGTSWDAAMLFAYSETSNAVQYMIGNPFTGPYLWIPGEEGTHAELDSNNIQLLFLEYSLLAGENEPIVEVLALTAPVDVDTFVQDFSAIIAGYQDSFNQSSPPDITTSTTTSETSKTTAPDQSSSTELGFVTTGLEVITAVTAAGLGGIAAVRRRK